jgi:hypothetical protein
VNTQRGADEARVDRKVGVEMGVTEKDAIGIGPAGIRRIDLLGLEILDGDHAILWRGHCGAITHCQTDHGRHHHQSEAGTSAFRDLQFRHPS